MKKFLATLLAMTMVFGLAACSSGTKDNASNTNQEQENQEEGDTQEGETGEGETAGINLDEIDDNMTSEDGVYEVAFITDVGQLKDKSFNDKR